VRMVVINRLWYFPFFSFVLKKVVIFPWYHHICWNIVYVLVIIFSIQKET
jgi:hypothetical protein